MTMDANELRALADAIVYRDSLALARAADYLRACADAHPAPAAPQAEPKREPLSDERIDEIGDPFGYFQYGDAQGDKRRAFARAVERAAYERAAQECDPHEDDDRIDRQIKWEIAERIRALGGSDGN